MTTGEVLTQALLLLKEKGWCTYTTENDHGQLCVQGAILYALNGSLYALNGSVHVGYGDHEAYQAAVDAMAQHVPEDFSVGHEYRYFNKSVFKMCSYNNTRTSFEDEIQPWIEKAIANEGVTL